ncbi:hypothetical protein P7C71_g5611, partial [Lecanoromycetidae sp. Uapishka_2]
MSSAPQSSSDAPPDLLLSSANAQPQIIVEPRGPVTPSLEDLQTDEQRSVLDVVAQVRKCGLESILPLPQLVVCGDQSAGKSSVLEALTEILFPRNDNLCTRFATEINLRRAPSDSLTIKIIPDAKRSSDKQTAIKAFQESITNFAELPRIMNAAMAAMDVDSGSDSGSQPRAFARDVLSIDIEGSTRPQLTLVDIPGLIQTDTKGVTKADVELVAEITDQYISQHRTICLAVISGSNDYANQKILTRVRDFDKDGNRTLGIITKPDRLPAGSGSEQSFIALARNEDIAFNLGWHVLKNRKFEECQFSLEERNASEATYFRTSNFSALPSDCLGIDNLRTRLSRLLFDHVRKELPKLRNDLEKALVDANAQLAKLGKPRTQAPECKTFLSQLSLEYYEACKAAVDGHYEGKYFSTDADHDFSLTSPATIRRIRAVVQHVNIAFAENIRVNGHKYQIAVFDKEKHGEEDDDPDNNSDEDDAPSTDLVKPVRMNKAKAFRWIQRVLVPTRGRELIGSFNPLLVGELLWEQCSKWESLAVAYLDKVAQVCTNFLELLLRDKCPNDVGSRLRASFMQDALKVRYHNARQELQKIMEDTRSYPINYNHYYTDTVTKRRQERQKKSLARSIGKATSHTKSPGNKWDFTPTSIDVDQVFESYSASVDPNMENVSCEEALDCLFAIYKVSQKTFIANVTTQVVERHIIRGIENIFSPVIVNGLSDSEATKIASEPATVQRQRHFLEDRIKTLTDSQTIFRGVMVSATL